jgi:hypothetical protein
VNARFRSGRRGSRRSRRGSARGSSGGRAPRGARSRVVGSRARPGPDPGSTRTRRPRSRLDRAIGGGSAPSAASSAPRRSRPDEDPVGPRLEPVRVAELRQLLPHREERLLSGVLGEVDVAKDPLRHAVQPVAHGHDQAREGLVVALLRPGHEVRQIHATPLGRPGTSGLIHMRGVGGPRTQSSSIEKSKFSRSRVRPRRRGARTIHPAVDLDSLTGRGRLADGQHRVQDVEGELPRRAMGPTGTNAGGEVHQSDPATEALTSNDRRLGPRVRVAWRQRTGRRTCSGRRGPWSPPPLELELGGGGHAGVERHREAADDAAGELDRADDVARDGDGKPRAGRRPDEHLPLGKRHPIDPPPRPGSGPRRWTSAVR